MNRTTTILACIMASNILGVEPWVVDRIIHVESSGNPNAIGDNGLAKGLAQFHKASWQDTSAWRRSHGMSVHDYSFATNPVIARSYLVSWLTLNEQRFVKTTGKMPTPTQLYAIHQLGFNGFAQRAFDTTKCPAITQRKTKQIQR